MLHERPIGHTSETSIATSDQDRDSLCGRSGSLRPPPASRRFEHTIEQLGGMAIFEVLYSVYEPASVTFSCPFIVVSMVV